jgi:hypothetical protein
VRELIQLDYAGRSSTLPHFRSTRALEEKIANAKTATLSFRIEPGLKEALPTTAEQEHRSIANMVEVMIQEYCGRNKITISELIKPVTGSQKTTAGRK